MIEEYIQTNKLFGLYMKWYDNDISDLIASNVLKEFMRNRKIQILPCTTATETIYDNFATWLYNQITDYEFVIRYGDRKVSRQLEKILIANIVNMGTIPMTIKISATITRIYEYVFKHNIDNWLKKFDAYNLTSYKPLDNYNMEEVRTPDLTETVNNTDSVSDTETGSNTKSVKTDITTTNDSESETGIFGFNSGSTSNPTADGTGSTTVHTTGSANDNTEQTNITGSHTGTKTQAGTKKNTGTETLTRSGNIGVTTSQQMLQSELELRNQILVDEIYKALAKYMTNPVY